MRGSNQQQISGRDRTASRTTAPVSLAAVIPALNEAAAIGRVVSGLVTARERDDLPLDRIIVVDNGSTDGTAEIARAAGAMVVREARRGYGAACLAGVRAAHGAGGTILLRASPETSLVRVEVVDSGLGIAPEDLPHVFDRSFRGDRARTRAVAASSRVEEDTHVPTTVEPEGDAVGAGLGLAIARGLIEAHGGRISVGSALGSGTRFLFTLRRA